MRGLSATLPLFTANPWDTLGPRAERRAATSATSAASQAESRAASVAADPDRQLAVRARAPFCARRG